MMKKNFRIIYKYCIVGVIAALVHALTLLLLIRVFPLWLSNILGFLFASIASYFGHALFTYKKDTLGSIFAKRWLAFQFTTNIGLSGLIPFLVKENLK